MNGSGGGTGFGGRRRRGRSAPRAGGSGRGRASAVGAGLHPASRSPGGGSDRGPGIPGGAAPGRRGGRRSGVPAFPALSAALFGRSGEPPVPSRRAPLPAPGSGRRARRPRPRPRRGGGKSRRERGVARPRPAASPLSLRSPPSPLSHNRPPAPLRSREMEENTKASGQSSRWQRLSRLPARGAEAAHRRELTVAVSLGCCAGRNQAPKPQVHLLPDPLRWSCGTADPGASCFCIPDFSSRQALVAWSTGAGYVTSPCQDGKKGLQTFLQWGASAKNEEAEEDWTWESGQFSWL
ncbi:serine/arginine-rich splicing factor SR45-like [Passer montanus]|uniref:serine/arginine-rich splicing factor SR45-like n=1 Tax=Passer montanus TaxID=9160 RepID=UPI001960BAA5|nr:serine/arginine-rich splicing factor SR45-like [Passer montanus]